jgi:hypothetical protein
MTDFEILVIIGIYGLMLIEVVKAYERALWRGKK